VKKTTRFHRSWLLRNQELLVICCTRLLAHSIANALDC